MANQTQQLADLLRKEGLRVDVVQSNAAYWPRWVAGITGLRALFRLAPYLIRLWRAAGEAQVVHVMANSGWSWHLFAAPAVWIARLRSAPVLVNYRGGGAEAFFARSYRWVAPTLRQAAAVVVPSAFLQQIFAQRGIGASIIPNIVDLVRFGAPRSVAPSAPQHIVVTRNLEPIYAIDTAIKAFALVRARLPEARLSIAGSGAELSRLKHLADTLGVGAAVTFCGSIDNVMIAELYRRADLMLNPSTVDNAPISILEALASGVPVVSTNVGGVPFLVKDRQTALLVAPGDAQAMASAAIELLTDRVAAGRLADAGRRAAEQFGWPVVRRGWLDVYRTLAHVETASEVAEVE
jgi:L-malate glycosyltransferase